MRWNLVWFAAVFLATATLAVVAEDQPAAHSTIGHAPAGIKLEMIAGITEADFLKLGDKPMTAKITLVAVFTEKNNGMNFNGYSHGKATYTIPKGWTVEVTFINPSPVPHSAVVVERDMVKKVQVGPPAFDGAAVPNYIQGLSSTRARFSFVAGETGDYAITCGFPTHALSGHWIAFNVRDDLKIPTLKLGEGEAREAK